MGNLSAWARKTDDSYSWPTFLGGCLLRSCWPIHASPRQARRVTQEGAYLRNQLGFRRPSAVNQVSKVCTCGSELIKRPAHNRCRSRAS